MEIIPNFYSIKPMDILVNQIIYVNIGSSKEKYEVMTKPYLQNGYCIFEAKDEIGNVKELKFNTNVETNIFVTKLNSAWRAI